MSRRTFAAQDLPPQGGFEAFQTARSKLTGVIKPRYFFALFGTALAVGMTAYAKDIKQYWRDLVEMRSAKNAILPILMAENDRRLLKHMRKMREHETELMKDSEGWTVGKYYGEPIYITQGDDFFTLPTWHEYYMFVDPNYSGYHMYDKHLL